MMTKKARPDSAAMANQSRAIFTPGALTNMMYRENYANICHSIDATRKSYNQSSSIFAQPEDDDEVKHDDSNVPMKSTSDPFASSFNKKSLGIL